VRPAARDGMARDSGGQLHDTLFPGGAGRGGGEPEGEARAAAELAADGEIASHGAREATAYRETESRAAMLPGVSFLHLNERLEDALVLVGGDADAAVGDGDGGEGTLPIRKAVHPLRAAARDGDGPTGRGELYRVRQDVHQNLVDAEGVAVVGQVGLAG